MITISLGSVVMLFVGGAVTGALALTTVVVFGKRIFGGKKA